MYLSQIKALSEALARHNSEESLNTMSLNRVAYHADSKEYGKIVKQFQRK